MCISHRSYGKIPIRSKIPIRAKNLRAQWRARARPRYRPQLTRSTVRSCLPANYRVCRKQERTGKKQACEASPIQTGVQAGGGSGVASRMHGHPLRSMYGRSQSGHWMDWCSGSASARSSDVGMATPGRSRTMSRKNSARSLGFTGWSAAAQRCSRRRLRQKRAFHLGHRWNQKYAAHASCTAAPTMYRATWLGLGLW